MTPVNAAKSTPAFTIVLRRGVKESRFANGKQQNWVANVIPPSVGPFHGPIRELPPEDIDLEETEFFFRNLWASFCDRPVDNFAVDSALLRHEIGEERRVYDFSLGLIRDPAYVSMLIDQVWSEDYRRVQGDPDAAPRALPGGEGVGVDFFARLLLRHLADTEPSFGIRRLLQFGGLQSFQDYEPQTVMNAGLIVRHFLNHFSTGSGDDRESFLQILRDTLPATIRDLEENRSYLILTSSFADMNELRKHTSGRGVEGNLGEFEQRLAESLQGLDDPEGMGRTEDDEGSEASVKLEDVWHSLNDRREQIVGVLNQRFPLRRGSDEHVANIISPRFGGAGRTSGQAPRGNPTHDEP